MKPLCDIRVMSGADLSTCDELRKIAGWNQRAQDWHRFLQLSPSGCFVALREGRLLGTVTTITYAQEVGWIGMLLVEPSARGQGIGTALLQRAIDYLRAVQVRCIKLDATPKGEELYRKIGFRAEWTLTRFERNQFAAEEISSCARKMQPLDLPSVVSLDAEAFGVARPDLIQSLWSSSSASIVCEENHRLRGFALLRSGSIASYFGPIAAESDDMAELLLRALSSVGAAGPIYWDVPDENESAVAFAQTLGFTPQRKLLRMFLGNENRCGNLKKYFGLADPSLG